MISHDRVSGEFRPVGRLPRPTLGLVLGFTLCLPLITHPQQARSQAPPKTIQALFISDIHFEPFWDPGKVADLARKPLSDWKATFESPDTPSRKAAFDSLVKTCPSRGVDTSYGLFRSALDEMKNHVAGAHFVTVSGDLMAHKFDCKFQTLFPKASSADYSAFTEKTIAFVMSQLNDVAGAVPVYAALGNNDSDCGDYGLSPNSPFLQNVGQTITQNFPPVERKAALGSFADTGSYSVSLPAPMANARLIVLDDLFFSTNYKSCSSSSGASGKALQLSWLSKQLAAARTANEKVWIMAHLPPGVDAFSTLRRGACSAPSMILSSAGSDQPDPLADAIAGAADVIQLGIFAHTHEDEIKLIEKLPSSGPPPPNQPAVPVKLVPSISPINGNLPSITLAEIDPATATLIDFKVIAGSQTVPWKQQYDYAQDYGEASFSDAAVRELVSKFHTDSSASTKASQNYIRNFVTGKPGPLLSMAWPAYVCTMTAETADGFKTCACPAKPPSGTQQ